MSESSTVEFLSYLRSLDVKVYAERDQLRISAPTEILTPELRRELTDRKTEILRFVKEASWANRPQTDLLPIVPADDEERLKLSFAERRLWFVAQLEGAREAYHITSGFQLRGELDSAALCRALDCITVRHEVLRTTFTEIDGQPVRRIASPEGSRFRLSEYDLRQRSDAKEELDRLMRQEASESFDLERGPLIRGQLIRQGEEEHALLITMHHIISDGWSMVVLINELSALYNAYRDGKVASLPTLSLQYGDYAASQRRWMTGEVLQQEEKYWEATLAGAPVVLELPTDRARLAQQDYAGSLVELELDEELTKALKALGRRRGATLFMTLLAGWGALLSRLSRQADLIIGVPVANRGRSEIEGLIGLFVNTLALRLDLSGSPTVGELLDRVKAQVLAAQQHQDIPFEQVVEIARPARSLSHSPLVQVMFAWQNTPEGTLDLSGLEAEPLKEVFEAHAKLDLILALREEGGRIVGGLEYATSLFERSTVEGYLGHLRNLLKAMTVDDTEVIDRLSLLSEAERRWALERWNDTKIEYPREKWVQESFEEQVERTSSAIAVICGEQRPTRGDRSELGEVRAAPTEYPGITPIRVAAAPILLDGERQQLLVQRTATKIEYPRQQTLHERFEAQVEKTPHARALTFEGKTVTYGELNARANQLANHLIKLGVGPDVLVGLFVERSAEMVIGILGILKAGGAYLPIDPVYPKDRLAFMLEDAKAPVLLTQAKLARDLPEHKAKVVCLDTDTVTLDREPITNLSQRSTPDNLAYVIYTSGSTGKPKGCLVTHYNVVRLMQATEKWYRFNDRDVWTLFHSHAFDFSVWELWGALGYGGRLVIVPYLTSRSPGSFYEMLEEEGVTVLNQTPSAFRQLMHAESEKNSSGHLALRYVIFGGEALEMRSLKPWFDRHGDQKPQLVNMYGITETTVHVTYRPLYAADVQSGSVIGLPIPDLQVYILDPLCAPVPAGVIGEIYVGGAGVALGYLNREELTRDTFVPNPFDGRAGALLYRSGDLARYLPSGDIEYCGRIDHQVKIRGYRIELGEIEAALTEQPEISQAVVVAREDTAGGKQLVAYLVASSGTVPSTSELRTRLKQKLPDYMIPAAYVRLEVMPLTPNLKIDHEALPAPEVTAEWVGKEEYAAPRTTVEQQLASIWAEVLNCQSIGIRDNFFDLGGHSLLVVQLIAKVRAAFPEWQPSVALLFKAPTVEQFASALKGGQAGSSCIVPMREGTERPPFFCLHGGGGTAVELRDLAMSMPSDQPFYCVQDRALDGHSSPFLSVEETADCYIEEIRRVQPHGPYYLGGRCYGGLVAYEMACRLRAMGETVSVLALIETVNHTCGSPLSKPKVIYFNSRFFLRIILDRMRILGQIRPGEWGWYLLRRTRNFLHILRDLVWRPGSENGDQFSNDRAHDHLQKLESLSESEKLLNQIRSANVLAAQRFVPKPYDGHLLVFSATKRYVESFEDGVLGWRPLALGGMTAYEIDGDHASIFNNPHVAALAMRLDTAIRETQRPDGEEVRKHASAPSRC